jgi:hypothetical protein
MAEKDKKPKTRATSDGAMRINTPKYEKPKPSFSIDEDELPEIKDWTFGKKYKLSLEVEMVSHSKGDTYGFEEGKKKHEARLKIISASPTEEKQEK